MVDYKSTLSEFMNAYYLRPETAVWRTADTIVMKDISFHGKSLDFGCGDGVFSFIRANGKFDSKFDVFQGTSNLEKFYDNVDVYDHDANEHIIIEKDADYKISVGFDHKQSLLNKSKKLNFYEKLICGDGNNNLPFESNEFDVIFSNIVYWLSSTEFTLKELHRILKPNASLYLMLPDKNFLKSSFFYNYQINSKTNGFEFLKKLDRGRISSNIKQVKNFTDWEHEITKAGFHIEEHKMHLNLLLLSIWDVGLRPIFPALARATNKMTEIQRQELKKEFIEIFTDYATPILNLEKNYHSFGFHFFELKKEA